MKINKIKKVMDNIKCRTFFKGLFICSVSVFLVFHFIGKSLNFKENIYPKPSFQHKKSMLSFKEVSEEIGINYKHIGLFPFTKHKLSDHRTNLYNGAAPSITVLDINTDGFPDIYITYPITGKKNQIYINKKGISFTLSKNYGLITDVNRDFISMRVAWFDFNNDGYEDIFIAGYGCHKLYVYNFRQQNYKEHSNAVAYCSNPWSINIADFNKDSYLDIIFANQYPPIDLHREMPKYSRLFLPRGDDKFGGVNAILTNQNGENLLKNINQFKYKNHSIAVGVSDVNNDTWPDVFIGNDLTYDRLYLNTQGRLQEVTFSWLKKEKHGFAAMNSDFIDLNNDLFTDLYVTNIFHPPFVAGFNRLWINDAGHKFIEKAKEFGIHKCGFAWGAKFADFDNDGDLDLVVGNGMFRGSQAKLHQSDEWFYKARQDATSLYVRDKIKYSHNLPAREYSGFQKTCLFENVGGNFLYISDRASIKGFYNSRALIILDFNNDGKMDFLTGNYNDKIKFYKNVSQSQGNWVGFDVRNKEGSVALGAKIFLSTRDGYKFMREIYPHNGFGGQNDWRVHFGIGKDHPQILEVHYRGKINFFKVKRINEYIKIKI